MNSFKPGAEYAAQLDAEDPLRDYRSRFHIPRHEDGTDVIYLCGHSLGLQPKTTRAYVDQELADWAKLAVDGHFKAQHPWLPYHEFLTEPTARLVGALPTEVVVMNSLTINLHLMMVSFYRPTPGRHKIVMEANAFPSDQYAVKSQIKFHGYDPLTSLIEARPPEGEIGLQTDHIEALLEREGKSIALLLLGGVNYYSGQAFDMDRLSRAAHAQGCVVGYDLAHAAGNIILRLHDWNADFAVWCSYKYLNAGPGSTAGCFVHERHANDPGLKRFAGWWGTNKNTRFRMGPDFDAIPGAEGWQVSNPPILALAAVRASMDIFEEVGMEKLRAKSEKLTGYLEFLLDQHSDKGYALLTPRDPGRRGAQLSIRVPDHARAVLGGLCGEGIICDWRAPDVIRVAPVPLYNRFTDVYRFADSFVRHVSQHSR
jgi:kynureninase